jgi:hypothetical protein
LRLATHTAYKSCTGAKYRPTLMMVITHNYHQVWLLIGLVFFKPQASVIMNTRQYHKRRVELLMVGVAYL